MLMSFYPYLLYYKALLNFCIYLYVELFEFKQQLFVTLYACSLIDKMYHLENYFMLCLSTWKLFSLNCLKRYLMIFTFLHSNLYFAVLRLFVDILFVLQVVGRATRLIIPRRCIASARHCVRQSTLCAGHSHFVPVFSIWYTIEIWKAAGHCDW